MAPKAATKLVQIQRPDVRVQFGTISVNDFPLSKVKQGQYSEALQVKEEIEWTEANDEGNIALRHGVTHAENEDVRTNFSNADDEKENLHTKSLKGTMCGEVSDTHY